jgi:uncharacterized membrane protein
MLSCSKILKASISIFMWILLFGSRTIMAQTGLTLYTPYTKISVPPGQSISYAVDVINNGTELRNATLSIKGIPKNWTYDLKSGGWNVNQISVLPKEKKTLDLKIDVPYKINKGTYQVKLVANGNTILPLTINVSRQGTYQTELTCSQANMEGHANATFTYNANLNNRTAEKQLYALTASTAPGWEVVFKANYKQSTSVEIEPNNTASISIDVNPPDNTPAGTYIIPIKAATNSTAANLDLQVVITGSYSMEVSTATGLLSTNITAGETKKIELTVKNTGSTPLSDITLNAGAPLNWEVSFEPKKIESIIPGNTAQVFAIIKADKKAIPGDYLTKIDAGTQETSANTSLRITVKTSMLWGWFGILIILVALGSVYYLFRRYGRR